MNERSSKGWNIIGLTIGILMVFVGLFVAFTPAQSYSTDGTESSLAFGADFYTYIYNATAQTANNSAAAANNVRSLGHALALYAGLLFLFGGLLVIVHYGKQLSSARAKAVPAPWMPPHPMPTPPSAGNPFEMPSAPSVPNPFEMPPQEPACPPSPPAPETFCAPPKPISTECPPEEAPVFPESEDNQA